MQSTSWPWRPRSGRRLLLGILTAAAICGCSQTVAPSHYRVTLPLLHATPSEYVVDGVAYRCYQRDDALTIVRELKAACLALGGTPRDCQTE